MQEMLNFMRRLIGLRQPYMTLIMTFDIEDDIGSSILFQKWILEARLIWKSGITFYAY